MTAPCKNCPDRELGCHAKCEKYAEYKVKQAEANKRRQEEIYNSIHAKKAMIANMRRTKQGGRG